MIEAAIALGVASIFAAWAMRDVAIRVLSHLRETRQATQRDSDVEQLAVTVTSLRGDVETLPTRLLALERWKQDQQSAEALRRRA